MTYLVILLMLLAGHAIADYPLQGDWLSKAKNQNLSPIAGETIWPLALASHAIIHALAVGLVTQSITLFFLEFIFHSIIDYSKCAGKIGYNTDQLLHIGCKLVWVILLITVMR